MDNTHHFGSGFAVHRIFEPCIKEFNPVSERISTLTINTSPINICLINGHAPTEVKDDNAKDIFYDELTKTYESITGNGEMTKEVFIRERKICKDTLQREKRKFFSKILQIAEKDHTQGRTRSFFRVVKQYKQFNPIWIAIRDQDGQMLMEPESRAESNSNDNGQRLIAFAISNGLTVSSTTFPHKNIHKVTWRSPDAKTLNQIDHVLIQTRYRSTIHDVRSHRGADCDTDHYLVIAKLRSKLKSQSRLKQGKRAKLNLELLKDENVRKNYENEVMKNLKENNVQMDVDLDWEKVSNAVKKAAATSIGELKRSKNTLYNDVCRIAVDKRRKARDDFIKHNSQITKEVFIRERKIYKDTLQREKNNIFSNMLQIAEKDHTQGRTISFFRVVKQYKQFNPTWIAIRDQDGQMLMEPESRAERWKGYFEELLNGRMSVQPVSHTENERAEPYVEDISLKEVTIAISGLKNWKAPGIDDFPTELIKYGGKELHVVIHRLCQLIWMKERLPDSWNLNIHSCVP
ncbi:Endonuclease/exonuclease/phosphatase [Cinara cedri]|uniref:Endonuclease/exonuclease/phosphatase n=1 Tax=Cinara cedri TaxID=506608 RepID=A0A5E4N572_9HEMI|nr:Endonuclease/exonuclease/phosphatase [Cinara cedri]